MYKRKRGISIKTPRHHNTVTARLNNANDKGQAKGVNAEKQVIKQRKNRITSSNKYPQTPCPPQRRQPPPPLPLPIFYPALMNSFSTSCASAYWFHERHTQNHRFHTHDLRSPCKLPRAPCKVP